MKAGVVVFPGSNCDRDLVVAFEGAGFQVERIWHKDSEVPQGVDVIGIPGGFSFGDYLRCGAIAARSPVCRAVADFAGRGGFVLGICNGFQVLTETGLLPGALMRNANLRFVCKNAEVEVTTTDSAYTTGYVPSERVVLPVAHHDGNYVAEDALLDRLEAEDRVAFRYAQPLNGSMRGIAGILSENRRVLGMMPHPERRVDTVQGGEDGARLFSGLIGALIPA